MIDCRMWIYWKEGGPTSSIVKFMNRTYPSDWTYPDFAPQFRAEFYGKTFFFFPHLLILKIQIDPNEWADIFQAAGARFVFDLYF